MIHRAWSWVLVAALGGAAGAASCTSVTLTQVGQGSGGGGDGSQVGVPCDVAQILANKCLSCHGQPPSGGAPVALVSFDDLNAPSSDPTMNEAELSLTRMQAGTMPPGGGAAAAEIAALQAWIDAGMPQDDCQGVVDPFGGPLTCTTGQTWPDGVEAPQMNPGEACIACHEQEAIGEPGIPVFDIAGTVYSMGHETNNCYGINGSSPDFSDVIVRIHDANGKDFDLKPGTTGNFTLISASFTAPYTAKVISGKGERAMVAEQTDGDCNLCHTAQAGGNGSDAPGRIVIPY